MRKNATISARRCLSDLNHMSEVASGGKWPEMTDAESLLPASAHELSRVAACSLIRPNWRAISLISSAASRMICE